ncbi:hypothetical protein ACR9E3_11595 [Actinomycetospora sp. C-140]
MLQRRVRKSVLVAVAVLLALITALVAGCSPPAATAPPGTGPAEAVPLPAGVVRPPAGGYFPVPTAVGTFSTLPDDAGAAAMVHRSPWEPRPQNDVANRTVAPPDFRPPPYPGLENGPLVFDRITGNFTGTTDEIIQWAAAKWGLPDDVIRAEAVQESGWFQNHKEPDGQPIDQQGFGDFGDCGGAPIGSPYGPDGPASFGIMQVKWCTLNDPTAPGTGGWPWTENSTAWTLDTYGAVVRACYEGWEPWLGPAYRAGDLWGCVGRWNSGAWHDPVAERYIRGVQEQLAAKPWLGW